MVSFVDDNNVGDFEHIADTQSAIWQEFGVSSQPAFVFINDDGATETLVSSLGQQGLTERVEALIAG